MDKYTDIDGIKLHYREDGPDGAPALVVMHGWGCNADTVRSITAVAAQTNKVYTIDFPGFGQTPEPPSVSQLAPKRISARLPMRYMMLRKRSTFFRL